MICSWLSGATGDEKDRWLAAHVVFRYLGQGGLAA
jgi:hypothetical protein